MPEILNHGAEIYQPPIKVEPIDDIAERYSQNLMIVPVTSDTASELLRVYAVAEKRQSGDYEWRVRYAKPAVGGEKVDPVNNVADKPVFDQAAEIVRRDESLMRTIGTMSEAWWNAGTSKELVEKGITEVFRVESADKSLDILNCTSEPLSADEQNCVQRAMQHVASYTGNKVFDRTTGVILATGDHFKDDSAGFYNFLDKTVRVNMDAVRKDANELAQRYKKYFPEDSETSFLEVIIAHELGHAMDINTLDEADAHNINRDQYDWFGWGNRSSSFSVFDNKFGWTQFIESRTEIVPGIPDTSIDRRQTVHRMNDAMESECAEYSPTAYGRTHPKEDFAESFAIAALGGDTGMFTGRSQVVAEALVKAEGDSLIGPQLVKMSTIACHDGIYRPTAKYSKLEVEALVTDESEIA